MVRNICWNAIVCRSLSLFFVVLAEPVRVVFVHCFTNWYGAQGNRHQPGTNVENYLSEITPLNRNLFLKIKAEEDCFVNYRYDKVYKNEAENSNGHQSQCNWVKLESRPVLHVVPPPGRKTAVSGLVEVAVAFRGCPSELKKSQADQRVHYKQLDPHFISEINS